MSEVITTGTDAIRQMLRVRNKKINLASLARDLGISSDMLDTFIDGKRSLPIPVLQDLTKVLWNGHAVYDPEVDRLRPARQEPAKPLGVLPSLTLPSTFKSPNRPRAGRTPSGKHYEYEGRPTSLPSPVIMASRLPPVTRSSMAGDVTLCNTF